MRVVRASALPSAGPAARPPLSEVSRESVSDLSRRFPKANLRRVQLVRAPELDAKADRAARVRVWLALESLQVTGSFKVRGALTALDDIRQRLGQDVEVVAASAGNHGAAVAFAGRVLGVSATVVMPEDAPLAKRSRVTAYGAKLVLVPSPHYDDAEAHALTLADRVGAVFVSPYDDPLVAAGNGGSLGFEIVRALGRVPESVLCPIGGGGLASGLGWALGEEAAGDGDSNEPSAGAVRRVWGVQSEASPAMALSLERGAAVPRLDLSGATLAEGLEGGISESGFARASCYVAGVIVASEDEIAAAMDYALRELGLALEGSAATALVPLLGRLPDRMNLAPEPQDVVAVLTGRNVDRARLLRLPVAGD